MKIILFANTDWYLYNFRLSLAKKLRDEGYEVVLVSPPGEYGPRLELEGFRWISVPFSTRSTNPLTNLCLINKIIKLYRQEQPSLVHHFTIKCVIYGSIAAKVMGGIKIVNAVTGLGHVFTDKGLKAKMLKPIVRRLYRYALGGDKVRVVFQNSEDKDNFVSWGLVEHKRSHLIRGSGVDTSIFTRRERGDAGPEKVILLFASRLLREKGVFELVAAFQRVKSKYPQTELFIAGELYPENPSSLTVQDVEKLKEVDGVKFLGHVDKMPPLLSESDMVVLPSYREGTPRILIEAAAMELPIVATDIAGCRGLVVDGVNGFLVPGKSVKPLADAMEKLVADEGLRRRMGQEGRRIVCGEFDQQYVNSRTIEIYRELYSLHY